MSQEVTTITQGIAKAINKFDVYYEMSDSPSVQNLGFTNGRIIKTLLKKCNTSEIEQVKSMLTDVGQLAFKRYFESANQNDI